MAEKEGFEPSIPFWGIHDFQSCALGQLRDFSKGSLQSACLYYCIYSNLSRPKSQKNVEIKYADKFCSFVNDVRPKKERVRF